jgi:hypothetical protein
MPRAILAGLTALCLAVTLALNVIWGGTLWKIAANAALGVAFTAEALKLWKQARASESQQQGASRG